MRENHISYKLVRLLGGAYLPFVLITGQLLWLPFFGIAAVNMVVNAEATQEILKSMVLPDLVLYLSLTVIGVLWQLRASATARHRLDLWKAGLSLDEDDHQTFQGWQEITGIAARYGWVSTLLSTLQFIGIMFIGSRHLNTEQMTYLFFASMAALVSAVLASMLWHENMLRAPLQILTPNNYDAILAGLRPRLRTRLLAVMFGSLLTTLFLLAPISYHQTYTILYRAIGSLQVFSSLRTQLTIAGFFSILLGLTYAYIIVNASQRPIRHMTEVFKQIEAGDLSRRLELETADEVGQMVIYFNRMLDRLETLQSGLEQRVAEQTAKLRATNQVGQAASAILDPGKLTQHVVELISEQFGYYYAAIFLADENGEWAELKAASGEAGKVLLQKKHRLEIGGKNMVGSAIRLRQARIALDVGDEPVRFNNPFLPYTRSEIALPLMVGDRVLGALDVQSTQQAAFSENDIETLQGMANQVAIALSNAQIFQQMQQTLSELQNMQRQYLLQTWGEASKAKEGLRYAVGNADWQSENTLNVPIHLRDQILGEIIVEAEDLSEEDRAWVESLATQAAVALENARLLEESQQTALRERLIAEISQKIWSAKTIEGVMRTAVRELGQALQAAEASLELSPEEEQA